MKHKMYILFLVILMIGFTLIITKDNMKSRFVSSKDIVDSSVEEDSSVVFRSKLTDENDNILSTEGLT